MLQRKKLLHRLMSGLTFHFRMQRSPKSLSTLAVVASEQLVRVIGMVKQSDQNRSSYKELIRYFVSWNLQAETSVVEVYASRVLRISLQLRERWHCFYLGCQHYTFASAISCHSVFHCHCWLRSGVSNFLSKCAKVLVKNLEQAIVVQIFCDVLWGFRNGPGLFL